LHLHLFNFLYRVRDLRPRWSTRQRAGFSCAILYYLHWNVLLVWSLGHGKAVDSHATLLGISFWTFSACAAGCKPLDVRM